MNEKSKLPSSLSRLLRKPAAGLPAEFAWFEGDAARAGRVDLVRAGEDKYVSSLLELRDENALPVLIVDRLMPDPPDSFWHEPVSLQVKISGFKDGMEEVATFRARVGERVDVEGHDAVELRDIADLERTQGEYVATLGPGHPLALSFVWFDSWRDVKPKRITLNRLFFDAELEDFISPEGYTISQAMLKLEKSGGGNPVKLQLNRARNAEYEAELTKIDAVARTTLTRVIEEIWRTDAGLASRKSGPAAAREIGYRKRTPDNDRKHFVLLSPDESWRELLAESGQVIVVDKADLELVSTSVSETPCDLFVADADLWGGTAIALERLLRSVNRYRMIPRLWISSEEVGQPWEASDVVLGSIGGEASELDPALAVRDDTGIVPMLDHVDFGAFDLLPRNLDHETVRLRLNWALGGDSFGHGQGVLLITQDARLRYRVGLAFLQEHGVRFSLFHRFEGLVPALDKRHPRWILIDAASFEVEVDSMLARAVEWTAHNRGYVIVLARGAEMERVTDWLRRGAKDIILLDPSLRETMRRLRARILGTE